MSVLQARRRLWAAMVVGGLCAGVGMVRAGALPRSGSLPDDAVARVGQVFVSHRDYQRALDAVARDRRGGLTEQDRTRVLQRLVDEELLVNHGVQLGLSHRDRQVRAALVQAVIALTSAQARTAVDDDTLSAFYRDKAGYFRERGTGRLPPFEQARERVRVEYTRRAEEQALRSLVQQLRRQVDVEQRSLP